MDSAGELEYPKQILAYMDGFLVSKTLFTACELGVFDVLLESAVPLSSMAIAQRLNASADGVGRLLDACVGLNLLEMKNDNTEALYKNTEVSATYLTQSSPKSLLPLMPYHSETTYRYADYLTDAVREGTSQHEKAFGKTSKAVYEVPHRSENEMLKFMAFLDTYWIINGRDVITAFDLSQFKKVCDLGGGSGTLAKQYILENPNSTVTVFDLPKVIQTMKKNFIPPEQGKITFIEGDFFEDPIPEADLYILARVLHASNEDQCLKLLTKIYNICKPGNGILLVETILKEDKSQCLFSHFSSLRMLLQSEGRERTASEYTELLKRVGFKDIEIRITGKLFDAILVRK